MNCLEFRRTLGVQPLSTNAEFVAHREQCARCADAHARAQAFERKVERALQVPVPEALADAVLLAQTTAARHELDASDMESPADESPRHLATPPSSRRPTTPSSRRTTGPSDSTARTPHVLAWRIAAGFLLLLGAAGFSFQAWRMSRPLSELAIAHLAHEPHALAARADIPAPLIAAAFRDAGAALTTTPARADYLRNCNVGGRPAVHLVVQRPEGPVTLLYVVAGEPTPRGEFAQRGMKGRTVPLDGGTLVLLASEDRSFDELEREWRHAITGFGADVAYAAP